jgi:hypothetical protein
MLLLLKVADAMLLYSQTEDAHGEVMYMLID